MLVDNSAANLAPDIETASANYTSRFAGEVGQYFLAVQEKAVLELLAGLAGAPLRILEVGGGHAQLTPALLAAGHFVTVHGSSKVCFDRLEITKMQYGERLALVEAPVLDLPFAEKTFDVVSAVRLLAHVDDWPQLVRIMTKIADRAVIVDYAPASGFNMFYKLLFGLKKRIERNTRTFIRHEPEELNKTFQTCGYELQGQQKQFFAPMVVHRAIKKAVFSSRVETLFRRLGFTALWGSPVISLYTRKAV